MKTKIVLCLIVILFLGYSSVYSQCVNCPGSNNNGSTATALGDGSTAQGHAAFASGYQSIAEGNYSTALGFEAYAQSATSFAIGHYVKASGDRSIVIGSGVRNASLYLENNDGPSFMVGFNSRNPTFFVSKPEESGPYFDKTGRIAIGNIRNSNGYLDPQAKLHLRSDEGEAATVFIEPSNWTNEINAEILMGNQLHGISAEFNKGLMFMTENYYLFNDGDMGIGTEEPAAKVHIKSGDIYIEDIDRGIIMKSPDGTCWRGTVNNAGQIDFEALDFCPEDGTNSVSDSPMGTSKLKVYPNPAGNQLTIEISMLGALSLNLEIIDELGKTVKSTNISDNKDTISIENLRPGIYYCKVSGEGIYNVEKFIKY